MSLQLQVALANKHPLCMSILNQKRNTEIREGVQIMRGYFYNITSIFDDLNQSESPSTTRWTHARASQNYKQR